METRGLLIRETDFVAFDVETTGLNPGADHIVEIGAIRFSGGKGGVADEFSQLVRPPLPIPPEATRIHGITNRNIAGQPKIHEVLPEFFRFIGQAPCVLVAHNARFDVSFLVAAARGSRARVGRHPIIDTYRLAQKKLPRLSSYSLANVARRLGIDTMQSHRALADCRLLKEVFMALIATPPRSIRVARLLDDSLFCYLHEALHWIVVLEQCRFLVKEALRRQVALEIIYWGGSTPGEPRIITPRQFTRSSGVLAVIAYCHRSHAEKTFRMDRLWICRRAESD